MLPLDVRLLRAELQCQVLDDFGVYEAGASESLANATDVRAREGRFHLFRYCVFAHCHPYVHDFPGPSCFCLQCRRLVPGIPLVLDVEGWVPAVHFLVICAGQSPGAPLAGPSTRSRVSIDVGVICPGTGPAPGLPVSEVLFLL